MKVFISILFTFFLSFKIQAGCVNSKVQIVKKGDCIRPSKNQDNKFGWEIPKRDIYKNNELTGTEFFLPDDLKIKRVIEPAHKSGKEILNRCNIAFNKSGLFHVGDYEQHRHPLSNSTTSFNLSHYWSFFDNFEADFLPRFSSEGDSSKTMHPLNPSSNLNNNTCNALGMCACDRTKSLRCTTIAQLNDIDDSISDDYGNIYKMTSDLNQAYPERPSNYDSFSHSCYFKLECKTGDVSPKKLCEESNNSGGNSNCNGVGNKCLYRKKCRLPPNSKTFSWAQKKDYNCKHDLQCGSSYCFRNIPSLQNSFSDLDFSELGSGICLPMAKCLPRCKRDNEKLETPEDFCCKGLVNKNGYCKNFGEPYQGIPSFITSIDESCTPSIVEDLPNHLKQQCLGATWHNTEGACHGNYKVVEEEISTVNGPKVQVVCEKNGNILQNYPLDQCKKGLWVDEKLYTKYKVLAYTRLFEGLTYVWGNSSSPGLGHLMNTYARAKNFGQDLQIWNTIFENLNHINIDELKFRLDKLQQGEGAATGVGVLKTLAEFHEKSSSIDFLKHLIYFNISGAEKIENDLDSSVLEDAKANLNRLDSTKFNGNLAWKERTLAGFLKGLNNKHGITQQPNGRFNATAGTSQCDNGEQIGPSWCKGSSGERPFCGDGYDGLRDGACIREGWRFNDQGDVHGSEGGGGFLDAIYPLEIRTNIPDEDNVGFNNDLNIIFERFINSAYAGGKKAVIGGSPNYISDKKLNKRFLNFWKLYADRAVTINEPFKCISNKRKNIPSYFSDEEAWLIYRMRDGVDSSISFEDYKKGPLKTYLSNNANYKRDLYHHSVKDIVLRHFISMHYHKYDMGKGTYRFFRDNRNTGEYNTVMDTINAAVWLSEFHLKFGELNQQISSCLMEKANEMDRELTTGNNKFPNDEKNKFDNKFKTFIKKNKKSNCLKLGKFKPSKKGGGGGGSSKGSPSGGGKGLETNIGKGLTDSKYLSKIGTKKLGKTILGSIRVGESLPTSVVKGISGSGTSKQGKSANGSLLKVPSKGLRAKMEANAKKLRLIKNENSAHQNSFIDKVLGELMAKDSMKFLVASNDNSFNQNLSPPSINLEDGEEIKDQENSLVKARGDEDDYEEDDDEDEEYSDGENYSEATTSEPSEELKNLYERAKKLKSKFKLQPNDTIFGIISKTYMTTGLRKLVGKRKRKIRKKGLPSLRRKHSKKKKSSF